LPNDKQTPRELKVTDKRIFTPEGDLREEFQNEIKPGEASVTQPTVSTPSEAAPVPPPEPERPAEPVAAPQTSGQTAERRRPENQQARPAAEERRRSVHDRATNPETPFTNFVEPLIAQGYMSLGLLRNPYQPQAKLDPAAARQMIDILALLKEKTAGNLTADEQDFLETHLGELKLAFVQRTKTI
jgi:type IV secretory pathway VirB10-like protein